MCVNNFEFIVLEYIENYTEDLLKDKELYWMDFYNSTNGNYGYNLRRDSSTSTTVHPKTRKLLSELFSGENNPNYNNRWSDKQKEHMSKVKKEMFSDGRLTVNLEGSKKGHKERSRRIIEIPGYKEKMASRVSNSKSKYDILKIDRDTLEILEEFSTFRTLKEKYPNVGKTVIFSVCNGNKKTYRGFLWRYRCKISEEILEPKIKPNQKKRKVINKVTLEIFESITEACKSINMTRQTLQAKLGETTNVVVPEKIIIEFKEALVFALMGVLRVEQLTNVLSSVTGAKKDSSSGVLFIPN